MEVSMIRIKLEILAERQNDECGTNADFWPVCKLRLP